MKHIAIVDIVGQIGGMNYYSSLLGKNLTKFNNKITIYSNFSCSNKSKLLIYSQIFNFEIKQKIYKTFDLLLGIYKINNEIKEKKINNIIIHIFTFNIVIYTMLKMLKSKNINLILIVHDIHSLGSNDLKFIQKKIINNFANKIVVHNHFSKKAISKILKNKNINLQVIPHGNYNEIINSNISKLDALRTLNLDKNNKYLLFFGQIKQTKGLEILLNSLKLLDDNINLIIAGRPWKVNFKIYENIITKNNLKKRIILKTYFIDNRERDLLFTACDICILPYKEIYQSGVLLTSMSYGLPTISSDLPPNKEIIKNYKNGLLFKDGNSKDLANKISLLSQNDKLYQKISLNSINTMTKYSWEKIAQKHNTLLI